MAAGSLDLNGIWQYGEDDERDTFSALLNIGQEATSDAIAMDRARIDDLVADDALGGVTAGVVAASSGWSITTQRGRKKGGLAFVEILFIRTGAAITVPASGDLADTEMGTFNAGWVPAGGMSYPAVSIGGRVSAFVLFSTAVQIVHTTLTGNIATNDPFRLAAVYPLA